MKSLITLAVYDNPGTAHFLKDQFEKAGLDCFLSFIGDPGAKADRVGVQVEEGDVMEGIRVMLGIRDEFGKAIEEIEPSREVYRILVPSDFSKGSDTACKYAIHLAQKIGAEIKVLHVYENPLSGVNLKKSATFESFSEQRFREAEVKASEGIRAFARKAKDYVRSHKIRDVRIHTTLAMGDVVRKIGEVSSTYLPDFIVLGTVGRREGKSSIFGGLVNELIQGLDIPIYAIPGPFAPLDIEKLNILYATDFNEKDNTSLNRLLKIVNPFDTRITCVHIDTTRNLLKNERMDELNAFLEKEYGEYEIHCRLIEDEDVIHGLKDYAFSNNCNLLSFTTRKRGIFEKLFRPNLFSKILQEANLPILVFPS